MTTPSDTRRDRIIAAFEAHFPDLAKDPVSADQYAAVAVEAIEPIPAGRCMPILRPHPWTRWRLIELPVRAGALFKQIEVPLHRQQRECARCGRVQRADLAP